MQTQTTSTTDVLEGHKLFASRDALESTIGALGVDIRLEPEIRELLRPVRIGHLTAPNRVVAQPMEGCDGTKDGRPDELTFRRWGRLAAGGFGMLWGEATAVVPEARANPRQLVLTRETASEFARLVAHARAAGDAVIGVQLTHSGRYSYPRALPPEAMSDDDLERLADAYVGAARLAATAGADFVDVKQCHGYLLCEMLATRPEYARGICARIRDAVPGLLVATRINADQPNVTLEGFDLVNVTAGCPYTNPHVGRPADRPPIDGYPAPEHPLIGVERHMRLAHEVRRANPALPVVGTGYSYLRHFLAMAGEACVRDGRVTLVGVGRGSFAYPDLVRDLEATGALDPHKTCLTVSHCTNLMRSKGNELGQFAAGCVPRDRVYAELLREARKTWT